MKRNEPPKRPAPEAGQSVAADTRATPSMPGGELVEMQRRHRELALSGNHPPRDRRFHVPPPPPRPRPQAAPPMPREPALDIALVARARQAARPSARTPRRQARANAARAPSASDDGSEPPPLDRRAVAKAAGVTLLGDIVEEELAKLHERREAA